jgi:hypothetical protein
MANEHLGGLVARDGGIETRQSVVELKDVATGRNLDTL